MLIIILLSTVLNETLQAGNNPIITKIETNMFSIFVVFGLLYWVGMARLVRGEILQIENNEYILTTKAKIGRAHV